MLKLLAERKGRSKDQFKKKTMDKKLTVYFVTGEGLKTIY